ncbi:MAG TPA: DUF2007 domain-containing protein [Planctomycetaceae bacterium]|jgi:hypothetical protein|nr:DUF2007 domain-containing protein [Planctomycetaceae bacterium]
MSDSHLVEICRAENGLAAHFIKTAIEDAGIQPQITDAQFAALAGLNPLWWESPRILVPEVDATRATAIVRDFEAAHAWRSSSGNGFGNGCLQQHNSREPMNDKACP